MTDPERSSDSLPDNDPGVIELWKIDAGIDEQSAHIANGHVDSVEPDDDPEVIELFGLGLSEVESTIPRDVDWTPSEQAALETSEAVAPTK